MVIMFALAAYVVFVILLGYLISALLVPIFGRFWRLIVAPGVIIHELAHALICLLVGARVHEINFWKASGGHVVYSEPRLKVVGPVLITFAPTIIMTGLIVGLAPILSVQTVGQSWFQVPPATFGQGVSSYLTAAWGLISGLPWLTVWPYLGIYLLLNMAVTIAPSKQDLSNSKWALVWLISLTLILARLFSLKLSLIVIWSSLAISLVYLGSLLGLLLVLWALTRLIERRPS